MPRRRPAFFRCTPINIAYLYANGIGTAPDYVRAYAWLVVADDFEGAAQLRAKTRPLLSSGELIDAEALAAELRAKIAEARP